MKVANREWTIRTRPERAIAARIILELLAG
jgi:hypothetical protein